MVNAGKNPTDAAERKGREAALAGLPESACPYQDKRQDSGRLTFSRAWRNAWLTGYRSAARAPNKD
jgi:ribosome modulation factor